MTEPTPEPAPDYSADVDDYTPPTHFTQVAVSKDVDLDQLDSELQAALGIDAEIGITALSPPPFSEQNVATLTIGTVGEGPSIEDVKEVVANHVAGSSLQTAPPAEPVFNVDPELEQAPSEEPPAEEA